MEGEARPGVAFRLSVDRNATLGVPLGTVRRIGKAGLAVGVVCQPNGATSRAAV